MPAAIGRLDARITKSFRQNTAQESRDGGEGRTRQAGTAKFDLDVILMPLKKRKKKKMKQAAGDITSCHTLLVSLRSFGGLSLGRVIIPPHLETSAALCPL